MLSPDATTSSQDWEAYAEEPAARMDFQGALQRWRESLAIGGHRCADLYVARYLALSGAVSEAAEALAGRDFEQSDMEALRVAVQKLHDAPGLEGSWLRAAEFLLERLGEVRAENETALLAYAKLARLSFILQLEPELRPRALALIEAAPQDALRQVCADKTTADGLLAVLAALGDLERAKTFIEQFGIEGPEVRSALRHVAEAVNAGSLPKKILEEAQTTFVGWVGAAAAPSQLSAHVTALLEAGQPWCAELLLAALIEDGCDSADLADAAAACGASGIDPALGLTRSMVHSVRSADASAAVSVARPLIERGFRREAARMLAPHADTHEPAGYLVANARWNGAPENRSSAPWRRAFEVHGGGRLKIGFAHALAEELDYSRAAGLLVAAAEEATPTAAAWRALANFYERTGQYAAWDDLISRLERTFPSDAWVSSERLKHDFETRNRENAEAAERAAEAEVQRSSDILIRRALAVRYPIEGRNQESAQLWSQIAASRNTATDHYHYTLALFRAGEFDQALRHTQAVLCRFPGDYRLHLKLAQTHERLRAHEAALQAYARALAIEPFNMDSCAGIARCLTYLERYDHAEAWLARHPQDQISHGWVHSARAFNEARAGNRAGATKALEALKRLAQAFDESYAASMAQDPANVWLNGRYVRHPAPSASAHGVNFARDLAAMRDASSVVLLGNSPQLIGAGKGAAIDSAGFVIRLNDFKTQGFEQDVGSRTDLWYSSANRLARPNVGQSRLQRIWLYQPYAQHFPELPAFAEARLGLPLTEPVARFLPPHIHTLTARLIYPRPSTGLRMIAFLEFFLRKTYAIAGFSFFQDKDLHYFDKGEDRLQVGEVHAIDFERDFVEEVLAPCGYLRHF